MAKSLSSLFVLFLKFCSLKFTEDYLVKNLKTSAICWFVSCWCLYGKGHILYTTVQFIFILGQRIMKGMKSSFKNTDVPKSSFCNAYISANTYKHTVNTHKCEMLANTYTNTHPYIHWSWSPHPVQSVLQPQQANRGNCHSILRGTLESWTWLKHMSSILIALHSPRWPEGGEGCLRSCVSCKNNLC